MPHYEYRCEIGHDFEVKKPMSEADREEWCPVCDHKAYRVFSHQRPVIYGGTPTHHTGD